MKNFKPFMKRVCAYTIDMFIVLMISSLISSIPVLNKNIDEYQKKYSEYEEKYNMYMDYLESLEDSYEDQEITEEEYNKLIENNDYEGLISSSYEDNKITEKEYKNIVSKVNEDFDQTAKDYVYILSKEGVSNAIVTLICTLLYFGVLQYFLKGQTIGKKILKLQVVSASDKKLNITNYLFRSLIVNDVLLNMIGTIFLLFTSKQIYTKADNVISILISIVEALIIFYVLTRDDARGLHDMLFNTKVIYTEESKEETVKTNNKKVIEAKIEEIKEEVKDAEKKPRKKRK